MSQEKLYLSPSSLATYANCPKSYYFDKVAKIKSEFEDANLGFGSAIAKATELHLMGVTAGESVDPAQVFSEEWERISTTRHIRYKRGRNRQALAEIGKRLMEQWAQAWNDSGFTLVLDKDCKPMLERKLYVEIGNNVVLVIKIDLCVYDEDGELLIIDVKTPSAASTVDFALMADQLTAYQLGLDFHSSSLGLPDVAGVGFWDMIKRNIPKTNRGEGPVICDPLVVEPRPAARIDAFIDKVHYVADQIRAQQFHPMPRMSFNSPCTSGCKFSSLCIRGETEGLILPAGTEEKVLALAA